MRALGYRLSFRLPVADFRLGADILRSSGGNRLLAGLFLRVEPLGIGNSLQHAFIEGGPVLRPSRVLGQNPGLEGIPGASGNVVGASHHHTLISGEPVAKHFAFFEFEDSFIHGSPSSDSAGGIDLDRSVHVVGHVGAIPQPYGSLEPSPFEKGNVFPVFVFVAHGNSPSTVIESLSLVFEFAYTFLLYHQVENNLAKASNPNAERIMVLHLKGFLDFLRFIEKASHIWAHLQLPW